MARDGGRSHRGRLIASGVARRSERARLIERHHHGVIPSASTGVDSIMSMPPEPLAPRSDEWTSGMYKVVRRGTPGWVSIMGKPYPSQSWNRCKFVMLVSAAAAPITVLLGCLPWVCLAAASPMLLTYMVLQSNEWIRWSDPKADWVHLGLPTPPEPVAIVYQGRWFHHHAALRPDPIGPGQFPLGTPSSTGPSPTVFRTVGDRPDGPGRPKVTDERLRGGYPRGGVGRVGARWARGRRVTARAALRPPVRP